VNETTPADRRRARVQAFALGVVLLASGLETLALMTDAGPVRDLLLGLIALAMLAAAVGG
jgi:hypothetical protein